MRRRLIVRLLPGLLLAAALLAPRASNAWVRGGFGIVYGGPYAFVQPYPPPLAYYPPAYYPPPYYPPAYYAPPVAPYWPGPAYVAPPASWPSYGPDIAVRWNRYFTPDGPPVQGYTLPR